MRSQQALVFGELARHRGRFRGLRVDLPRDVVRVDQRAFKARLARQRGLAGPVGPSDEGETRHDRSSGLVGESWQFP
jgi:hypothetical protein